MANSQHIRTAMQGGFATVALAVYLYYILYRPIDISVNLFPRHWHIVILYCLATLVIVPVGKLRLHFIARRKIEKLSTDERRPILYFRPFSEDKAQTRAEHWIPDDFLAAIVNYPIAPKFAANNEQQLASVLAPIGPMVALRRPGEWLLRSGAARISAPDDKWMDTVDSWLARTQLVILRAGTTEGLWWEKIRAFKTVGAEKILLLLLWESRALYESEAERMKIELGIDLPCFAEVQRWGQVSGFFTFKTGQKPSFLPIYAPFVRTSLFFP